jgi:hypothetical protein
MTTMNKTTIRISQFTQDRLKEIARRKRLSVSQLISEISLRYIGAEEGARMMERRAVRADKNSALKALEVIRQSGRPPISGDETEAEEHPLATAGSRRRRSPRRMP